MSEQRDTLTRLETKLDATLPHLGTKAELSQLATKAEIAQLATKAELAELRTELATMEKSLTARIARLEEALIRIEATLNATLPHLATKAELAEKPSKAYLWGVLAALLTAYAAGLAALAILK